MSQTQCNSHSLLTVMIDYIKNDTNLLTITALLMLCLMLFVLLPSECFAETLDYQELQEEPLRAAGRRILPKDRDAPRMCCRHRLDDRRRLIRGAVIRHHHMQVLHRLIEDRLKLRADVRRTVICT